MGISLGLVGLGAFGQSFAPLFKSHPQVDRIALCDREPERIQRFAADPLYQDKFSPSDAYEDLDAICRSDLDAIVLITQPWLHAAQAIQVMESGKHVYSAVPIVSLPDGDEILDWCDKLIDTCKRTGKRYMLGETTYYRPETVYCRRRAAEGAFGQYVYGEGEYYHDIGKPGEGLWSVREHRLASKAGQEWAVQMKEKYGPLDLPGGPMHYPTHSTCGPIAVMGAHAVKACCFGQRSEEEIDKGYFGDEFANETALFLMSNGATVRINEHRKTGHPGSEIFRVFGTKGCFRESSWRDHSGSTDLSVDEMRDSLPAEVYEAFSEMILRRDAAKKGVDLDVKYYKDKDFQPDQHDRRVYGGHGGSHAFLAHEFVDAAANDRQPAINAWEAARYMAPGVMAHKSALKDGELLDVPDWGDAPE